MRISMQNMKKKSDIKTKEYAKRILTNFAEYYIILNAISIPKLDKKE